MNKRQKQRKEDRISQLKAKKRRLQLTLFPTMAVLIVIVLIAGGILPIGNPFNNSSHPSSFSPPQVLPWGSFAQISDSNFGSHVNIYYVSWYGCPFGAADSWGFYLALQHYGNVSMAYPSTHYSNANDIYPDTPGLIFYQEMITNNLTFTPIYLYNQTMTGTTQNVPITGSLLSYGLNHTASAMPPLVASFEKDAMTAVPTQGFKGPTGEVNGHVNTNIIITGPKGAWILNGPLFSPSNLKGDKASTLLTNASSITYFLNAENAILKVIGEAQ